MCELDILGPVSSCREGPQSTQDWSTFFLPHNESAHLCVCGQQVRSLTEQRFNWSC